MIRVCLIGLGRAGKEIARTVYNRDDMKLVSAICSPDSEKKDKDLGEIIGVSKLEIPIVSSNDLEVVLRESKPNVIVDFSNSKTTMSNIEVISNLRINTIIGTTGFANEDLKRIESIAINKKFGIIYAPNVTVGVNVLMTLTKIASVLLDNYDFQITEIHHKHKKDIPSGTAVKIKDEILNGLEYKGKNVNRDTIPINSVRAGGIVGKHEVLIAGEDDRITISHESFSRKIFASGTIKAIEFINNKVGFYEMKEVMNLSKIIEDLFYNNSEEISDIAIDSN